MIIGVPKEIKDNENRIGCTPAMAQALVEAGHTVLVEKNGGVGSGFNDKEYQAVGATINDTPKEIFAKAQMIIKVKEPLEQEWPLLRPGQILFTYLHLAPDRELTEALLKSGCIGIAYESVSLDNGALPLLIPMSEVAGRMSVHIGAYYLARPNGGCGTLLQGVPGVPPANTVVLGGGTVGLNATKIACGMGARVTVIEANPARIRYLDDILPKNAVVVQSNRYNVQQALKDADLVVGAVLVNSAKTPHLLTREMLKLMKPGAVIVDVAVDQGGCVETTHATTHSNPTYVVDGVLHYCVANMPGAFARTSTIALTNATLPYALMLADLGAEGAMLKSAPLARGTNVYNGVLACRPVGEAHGLPWRPITDLVAGLGQAAAAGN